MPITPSTIHVGQQKHLNIGMTSEQIKKVVIDFINPWKNAHHGATVVVPSPDKSGWDDGYQFWEWSADHTSWHEADQGTPELGFHVLGWLRYTENTVVPIVWIPDEQALGLITFSLALPPFISTTALLGLTTVALARAEDIFRKVGHFKPYITRFTSGYTFRLVDSNVLQAQIISCNLLPTAHLQSVITQPVSLREAVCKCGDAINLIYLVKL